MVERLAPEWQSAVRQIDVATLKGKTSEDELFEVLWQKEDATSMLPAIALGAAASREKQRARRLRVRFQGEEIVVDDSRANIAIGRAEENDIVVKGNLISRLHARIELSPQQVPAGRPEHQRHVRHHARRRGSLRPPRQHAAERRGLDRLRPRAGDRLVADRASTSAKNKDGLQARLVT